QLPHIDTLPIRPIVYGKGVQRVSNYRTADIHSVPSVAVNENLLRSLLHFLLAAEMGLGVDVTATSIVAEMFRMKTEVLAYKPTLPPSVPVLVGAGLDPARDVAPAS